MKKALLLAFLLIGSQLSATVVEFWDMTSFTGVEGNVFTENGTVVLNGSPNCTVSTSEAGTFTDNNYLTSQAPFDALVSGDTTYTDQCYFYANSIANGPVIFSFSAVVPTDQTILRVLANGALRLIVDGISQDSATGKVVVGTCYMLAMSYEGSNLRAFVSVAGAEDSTIDLTMATANATISGTMWIGRLEQSAAFRFPLNGFVTNILHSDIQETTFPIPAPTPAAPSGFIRVTPMAVQEFKRVDSFISVEFQ